MAEGMRDRDRDLVLPPNTFAFVLDSTKGKVNVYVGPYKSALSDSDRLVYWDEAEDRFVNTTDVDEAVSTFVKAREGQYIILANPAGGNTDRHPQIGNSTETIDLDVGRKIVIPGPATFPLWPGQTAQTIDGHHLRHNQYLLVRVYEPSAARDHAESAVVAPPKASEGRGGEGEGPEGDSLPTWQETPETVLGDTALTMGQLIVIRGTNDAHHSGVSYYIPSTGIEVLPDSSGNFVREAATLERLEYCILLDESGEKRYVRGPAVVFPEPTETFVTNVDGDRKSKAIELNEQSGLYVKVIASYQDSDGDHEVGEELFLTGKDQINAIYYPRPEHLIITYGEQRKHHAIAVPAGEGRYVLQRETGVVELVKGPKMFLPDPRHEVIVKRILPPSLVAIMYPGNQEAITVNEQYQQEKAQVENVLAGQKMADPSAMMYSTPMPDVNVAMSSLQQSTTPEQLMRSARSRPAEKSVHEQTRRGTAYTPPRTIVLDNKYSGAVEMNLWPGYAVLLVSKTGERRVVVGPGPVLLEYDESPMVLSISKGTPKSDDNLLRTPYLRTDNQISDQLTVETQDLVPVTLRYSLRVKFETNEEHPDPERWFATENYVKVLTDHCRSRLRNAIKRKDIQTFYGNPIDVIRDTLLGVATEGERPGLFFEENAMRLFDVEVLAVNIMHPRVEQLLAGAMNNALEGSIGLAEAEARTRRDARFEELKRESLDATEETKDAIQTAALDELKRQLEGGLQRVNNSLTTYAKERELRGQEREETLADAEQKNRLMEAVYTIELARTKEEVEQYVTRVKAISPDLIASLNQFGDEAFLQGLMENLGKVGMAMGVTTGDMFAQIFKGTPFEKALDSLAERPFALAQGQNGD